jgi:murein DD-endopeptidase MepM/ murein hydrolase activator NlpD
LKLLFILLLSFISLFSSTIEHKVWDKGESLLTFFKKNHISKDVYFNLSKTDKELCSEIIAGTKYHIMINENDSIDQVLIPISEEMQIHIQKENVGYSLDIIPIEFTQFDQTISISINSSPYKDIVEQTNNKLLARELLRSFKKNVPFKKMRKGNHVVIHFSQRVRLGQYFGAPKIKSAMVEVRKRKYYIFKNEKDDRYYDEKARSMTSFFLKVPLRYKRISSKFTYKRYHPILKKYKAHLGIDYAAPTGRKIFAAASGKIIHRGRKGGYGKTIIIRHKNGYKTLYAHQYKFAKGLRVGSYVKQGRLIGYVGSTGRSTGPHLHFGLYKNGRAVNPNKIIRVTKTKLKGKVKNKFVKFVKLQKIMLDKALGENKKPLNFDSFKNNYPIEDKLGV